MGLLRTLLGRSRQPWGSQREELAAACTDARVRRWLRTPLPPREAPFETLPLLALDLELTGLDARTDRILSVGWVPLDAGRIRLAGAAHRLVADHDGVGQSARIHGILDREAREGEPLEGVLAALAEAMTGRIPVMHHAPLDRAFLEPAYTRCFAAGFPGPVIDTLALEARSLRRRHRAMPAGALRLAPLRAYYGLPPATSHNALADALATAELLLAMATGRGHQLRDLT